MASKKYIDTPTKQDSSRIKAPGDLPSTSTNDLHPAFCFRYIEESYSLRYCPSDVKSLLSSKLEELGRLSWGNIQNASRKGKGHEKIILKSPPRNTPGDREFLSFRLGGGKNSVFVGYRKHKIFYIIYVDPLGRLYSHGS